MPDSCRICGEPMLPALSTSSPPGARRAGTISLPVHTCAPAQRRPASPRSTSRRATCAVVHSSKLGRPRQVGRRKALAAFQRQPAFWLTSK
jgi:hypothetical protein